jgi:hypothetical protein
VPWRLLTLAVARRVMSAFFAGLPPHDLRRAIDQAFAKFDTDGSGALCERVNVYARARPSVSACVRDVCVCLHACACL